MLKARTVLNAVFLLVVLFNLFSWFILPDNVAIHFGGSGAPDSWMSKGAHILIFMVLMAVLYGSFALSPRLLDEVPKKYISLPNSDYWLLDENMPEAKRRMENIMYTLGVATGLLMLGVLILIVAANLSDTVRLNGGIFLVMFISYIAYTAWWLVRVFAAFRVPGTGSG
ncbi:MAG: DUF1648 domain-containing protein [Candidatus Krumholzibacteria bacterium]|nr:DUF1648 domain-containing protein [Candidatus Krumholzibacteria bacterium]